MNWRDSRKIIHSRRIIKWKLEMNKFPRPHLASTEHEMIIKNSIKVQPTSTVRFKILTAIAELQACVITITWLNIGVLVNDIDRRLLNHTRRVSTVAAKRGLAAWTSFCLIQYWHEHQAPDDAFHIWFHFNVDRDFHCWHFLCLPFMGMPTIEKIDTLLAFFLSGSKSSFSLSNFNFFTFVFTLEHFLFIFHNLILSIGCFIFIYFFQPISRCFFSLHPSLSVPLSTSIKYRFECLKRKTFWRIHFNGIENRINIKIKFFPREGNFWILFAVWLRSWIASTEVWDF